LLKKDLCYFLTFNDVRWDQPSDARRRLRRTISRIYLFPFPGFLSVPRKCYIKYKHFLHTHLKHKFILWSAQGKQVKRQLLYLLICLVNFLWKQCFPILFGCQNVLKYFREFFSDWVIPQNNFFENSESFQYINTFTSGVRPWKTKALNIKQLYAKNYIIRSLQYTLRLSLYIQYASSYFFILMRKENYSLHCKIRYMYKIQDTRTYILTQILAAI
jgi:hypothetical protein